MTPLIHFFCFEYRDTDNTTPISAIRTSKDDPPELKNGRGIPVFGMVFVDFNVVWRYFAWTNQTLAVFALWAGTIFLYKNAQTTKKYPYAYFIALIPALFMTMVSVSYIFIAPEGFHLAKLGLSWVAYLIAGMTTLALLIGFAYWAKANK